MKTVLLSGGKAKGRLALCAVPTYCSLQRLQHPRSGHNEHSESTVSTATFEEILIEDKKRTGGTWRFTCMSSEELKQGEKGPRGNTDSIAMGYTPQTYRTKRKVLLRAGTMRRSESLLRGESRGHPQHAAKFELRVVRSIFLEDTIGNWEILSAYDPYRSYDIVGVAFTLQTTSHH
jgi:hypothetical protein